MKKKGIAYILILAVICTFAFSSKIFSAEQTGNFIIYNGESRWDQYIVGDFSTDITINGKKVSTRAYCAQHAVMETPHKGVLLSAKVLTSKDSEYNAKLAAALYYGIAGPGNILGSTTQEKIVATSMVVDHYFSGTSNSRNIIGNNQYYKQLVNKVESGSAPSGLSYIIFRPVSSSEQITVAFFESEIKGSININKTLAATDNDSARRLDGAGITITNTEDSSKRYTGTTNSNGEVKFNDVPGGTYTVEETTVPNIALKAPNKTATISSDGQVVTVNMEDASKAIRIKIVKKDADKKSSDPNDYTQGDATFVGAEYTIYRDSACTDRVKTMKVEEKDSDGYYYADSGTIRTGTYYVKETKAPEGYLIDETVYEYSYNVNTQTQEIVPISKTSTEKVKRGRIGVYKAYDQTGSTECPAKDVRLKLVLNSAVGTAKEEENTYYAKIDKNGYAEFFDTEYQAAHPEDPYTIPYGKYTISEVEDGTEGNEYFFMDDIVVNVNEQGFEKYFLVNEKPVTMFLRIHKMDKDSSQPVNISGGIYKVWDCQNDGWVRQQSQIGYIEEFSSNEKGIVTLPHELNPGRYLVYEIEAPQGYYLDEDYRLPNDPSKYGKEGGAEVIIDKEATGLNYDAQSPDVELYYDAYIYNTPLKAKLEIIKTAEVLTDATQETVTVDVETLQKYGPVYQVKGLPGVTYEIVAVNDILSPDKTYTYLRKGEIADTVTTDDDGIALTKELYLGEYEIRESKVPAGYLKAKETQKVTLENNNQNVKFTTKSVALENIRQKGVLNFIKEFGEQKYILDQDKPSAIFGVYANEDIYDYKHEKVLIRKDSLIDVMSAEPGKTVETTVDMPLGSYYYKELWVSAGYVIDSNIHEFTFTSPDDVTSAVVVTGETVINPPVTLKSLYFIKVSASSFMDANNTDLATLEVNASKLNDVINEYMEKLENSSVEDAKGNLESNGILALAGAEYGIYLDKDCTKPLRYASNGEEVRIVTDGSGFYEIKDLPQGEYYLKELVAPTYSNGEIEVAYDKKSKPVKIEATNKDDAVDIVYRALWDEASHNIFLEKTDVFTGENVPNCVFEIRELDTDKLVFRAKTDKNGEAEIPLDLLKKGEKYTYQELEAPDVYKEDGQLYTLNTEKHEFTVDYEIDENGKVQFKDKLKVENYRPTGDVVLQKKDFADSTVIPNCKFELRSLETDYVVEGVTDENGEYVFKDVPYGKYTYTELEAPDEYILDTEPHEIEINSKETRIEITNEKKPDTSDIAVTTLVIMAVMSVLGISYVGLKNKKINN